MALLSIEGVRKEYSRAGKRVLALDSIDLDIPEGEFVTIVGPSGCGKSTLLNLIVGLLRSTVGRIVFRGVAHRRHLHANRLRYPKRQSIPLAHLSRKRRDRAGNSRHRQEAPGGAKRRN